MVVSSVGRILDGDELALRFLRSKLLRFLSLARSRVSKFASLRRLLIHYFVSINSPRCEEVAGRRRMR